MGDLKQKTFLKELGLEEDGPIYPGPEPESCLGKMLFSLFSLCRRRAQDVHVSLIRDNGWSTAECLIEEHRTIRLKGVRQVGHSTAVAEMARMFQKTLVVVPTASQRDHHPARSVKSAKVVSFRTLDNGSLRGCSFDAIFVDGASECAASMDEAFALQGGSELISLLDPEGWVFLIG